MWKAKKQGKRGSEEEESVIDLEERGRPRKKDTQGLCYAPINVKPHYPPPGLTRGLVGDFDLI